MNKKLTALVIAGSLAVSLSAFATKGATYHAPVQEKEKSQGAWYIGAGTNWNSQQAMNKSENMDVFNADLGYYDFNETEMSSSDMGFDVYVGYDINKYWAAELGYTYVGNINFDFEDDEQTLYTAQVKQWNIHLVGIGKLPVGDYVNFFLKGGIEYFSTSEDFDCQVEGFCDYINDEYNVNAEFDSTSSTFALTYGAGAELVWENWGLRGEYNVTWPATNVRDDFYIADVISANIFYKFN
jgi:outer membrane protein assembly factor BamA